MFLLLSEERAMRVGRLSTWIVLIASAVIIMSGYNSLLMAQSNSNANNNNAELSKLPPEVPDGEITKLLSRILDKPEPMVRLHTLGESSVDFVVRPWVKVDDYWNVYWDVTRTVKMRFDEAGVSIPFPQRDVHIYNEDKLAPALNSKG
jgi:small-conductance mechanosensitive channel